MQITDNFALTSVCMLSLISKKPHLFFGIEVYLVNGIRGPKSFVVYFVVYETVRL